jgi:hypothetical protein
MPHPARTLKIATSKKSTRMAFMTLTILCRVALVGAFWPTNEICCALPRMTGCSSACKSPIVDACAPLFHSLWDHVQAKDLPDGAQSHDIPT